MATFRKTLSTFMLAMLAAVVAIWAQSRVDILNGVAYKFPTAQGSNGDVLTNDGSGTLTWAPPATPEGLPAGTLIALTTGSCPSGWTRYASADDRFLRGSTTAGTTGGADSHGHSMTGVTGSTGVSITGSTASADANHTHTYSGSSTTAGPNGVAHNAAGAPPDFQTPDITHAHNFSWSGTTSGASDNAAHSHGAGTLAGGSHGHSAGSLAAASTSNVPAFISVILCRKD